MTPETVRPSDTSSLLSRNIGGVLWHDTESVLSHDTESVLLHNGASRLKTD